MIEHIRELAHAMPFEPFALILANGKRLNVPHPDYIWVHPTRKQLLVADNITSRFVNVSLIAAVEEHPAA